MKGTNSAHPDPDVDAEDRAQGRNDDLAQEAIGANAEQACEEAADDSADDADQKIDQKVLLASHHIGRDDARYQAYDQKIDQAHGVVLPCGSGAALTDAQRRLALIRLSSPTSASGGRCERQARGTSR